MAEKALTEMTPAAIDGELATIHEESMKHEMRASGHRKVIEEAEDPTTSRGRRLRDNETHELYPWEAESLAESKRMLAASVAKLAELKAAAEPFTVEFGRRGGWRRYFLVTSSDGHIHRGMHCETCYHTTTYGWLPELSDCVEEAMVEKYGMKACTICFPEAPTMPGWTKAEKEAAAAAEKAAGTHCSYKTPARDSVNWKLYYKRGACPECGARGVGVTSLGRLRKHKRPTPK